MPINFLRSTRSGTIPTSSPFTISTGSKTSPDSAALPLLAHHLRAVRAAERLLERRHVRDRAVHAERPLRVRVGQRAARRFLGRHVLAPHLRETEEETLLGGEAVDRFARLALQRVLVRGQRDR